MVGINDDSPAAIAEGGPAVCSSEEVLGGQLARAHLFVAPEDVTLRMGPLGEQSICDTHSFYCLTVVKRADFDAGFAFETFENLLGIDLVLRAIDDHDAVRISGNSLKRSNH